MNKLFNFCGNILIKPFFSSMKSSIHTLNCRSALQKIPKVFPLLNTSIIFPYKLNISRNFANHRHKKVLKLAKGYRGRAKSCFTVAIQRVQKARQYAYRDRKVKKREFRKLWIQRINASSRMYGLPYSKLINNMLKTNIILNRKVLSDLAVTEPLSFKSVVEVSKISNKI